MNSIATNKQDLVFIVEDNDMYSMMLEYCLSESDNYRFRKFDKGEDCINSLKENPMAIVLDFFLPGMNGLKTFRMIREKHPQVPVIMLSVSEDRKTIRELFAEGLEEYIVKGKDSIEELKESLQRLVNGRKAERAEAAPAWRKALRVAIPLILAGIVTFIVWKSV
ncbi:MAG: response regulator [Bacteroidota bacterium]